MSSVIVISPVFGEPFEVKATASKYAVQQNDEIGTLRESIRFRFNECDSTIQLGYSVEYEELTWIIRDAQKFPGARRIVVDAERETLDYSRCQLVDIYQWESEHDCNSRIAPVVKAESVKVSVVEGPRTSISIHDARRSVSEYHLYLEPDVARQLTGLSLIRGKQDFKVVEVERLDTPGRLALVRAKVHQAKIAEVAGEAG